MGSDFGGDRAVREASRGRGRDPAKGTGPPPTIIPASEQGPGAWEAQGEDPVATGCRGAGEKGGGRDQPLFRISQGAGDVGAP